MMDPEDMHTAIIELQDRLDRLEKGILEVVEEVETRLHRLEPTVSLEEKRKAMLALIRKHVD